jgi:hypothetical protein
MQVRQAILIGQINFINNNQSCPFQKPKHLNSNKQTTSKHPKSFPKRKLLGCLQQINV